MNILIAMDSFKGSATSLEAGTAAKMGILKAIPDANVQIQPLADGGEGTVTAFLYNSEGLLLKETVTGPLGQPVIAQYGKLKEWMIVEVAETSGLTLIPSEKRNPWAATSFGFGELIAKLIKAGERKFILALGGSATNDAGLGMLQALGYQFLDEQDQPISTEICEAPNIAKVSDRDVLAEIKECTFLIANDVDNPLTGKNGATYIYGAQKGVEESEMQTFDHFLGCFAQVTSEYLGEDQSQTAGAGAAGGLGFAILSYLNGTMSPGFQLFAEFTDLADKLKQADLIITGEGRLDGQSLMGKGPIALAQMADSMGKSVIAIVGSATEDAGKCNEMGISAFFTILQKIASEKELLSSQVTKTSISTTAEQLFRFYQMIEQNKGES